MNFLSENIPFAKLGRYHQQISSIRLIERGMCIHIGPPVVHIALFFGTYMHMPT